MTSRFGLRGRFTTFSLGLATVALVPGLAQLPAVADNATMATDTPSPNAKTVVATLGDAVAALPDLDVRGTTLPSAGQRRAAARLGAVDLRWNDFGTPASILPVDGLLAKATSTNPVKAARSWLSANATVFGLTPTEVADLDLVNDQELAAGGGHAVLFRQRFGGLVPAIGSMVTVGVARGEIAYVSSSITKTTSAPAAPRLSPLQGWLKAVANVGRSPDPTDLARIAGRVTRGWTRLTVPGFAQPQQVRLRALPMADGSVRPVLEANVVDVAGGSALAYTLLVDAVSGSVLHRQNLVENAADQSDDARSIQNPRWRYFTANPALDFRTTTKPKNSVVGCWSAAVGCTGPTRSFANVSAPGPWDSVSATGLPTLTTIGNNANTHEAWLDPLAPGGLLQAPISPTRDYTDAFTDAWNNSRCDPTNLIPLGNDILPVVTNLFVAHNRMHDYAYYLGFTEKNYNLQLDNLGRGGVGLDQEIGNAQAGAITGGQPLELGRDNANQITLQDGIPGITNQYLFQPLAGAFYSPCTDGGFDMSIVGHEYTHAISNRMIGGPDDSITSEQGGAMGESWSDLTAAEYLFSHGYSNGADPWAVGPYATGNRKVGIRDYAIDKNPLNYSDYGFDTPGVEVHADGEIWNGTQWEVRQALVDKYDQRFPYGNKGLQRRCAEATATKPPLAVGKCPGNRRWIQLIFDAYLLQQGGTSMLDARDAMLAADRMRFGGKDQSVMWAAFARRGMGKGAHTTPNSGSPTPSFAAPGAKNARVSFKTSGKGKLFVGDYEARATPIADTLPSSKRSNSAAFTPGTYRMLFASRSHGFKRFTMTVKAGQDRRVLVVAPHNLAAKESGAKVLKATPGSLNANQLIDGTEDTNWGGVTATNVDRSHPFVAVDLSGGVHRIKRVQVSAMLNPAGGGDADSGSRFTALRKFALDACVQRCSKSSAKWKRFYTSKSNAFPALVPRPVAPNLTLRSFHVKPTRAAAVRLVVLENQCTGTRGYAGEQDSDPFNDTDCKSASDRGKFVHVAELQVF
ncbi:M36 family metallopeptidase [Nocardioides sp.]|uniref:M36 family metallopeptidase n=1 Tax=Nocardioides sp. TaxID=35761 RepID=UPI0031FE5BA1|nr:peptidase fungalysin [Nocardioides sp.]